MKMLNLRVDDALYEPLLTLLKRLPQDKIQVVETPKTEIDASEFAGNNAEHLMRLAGRLSAFRAIHDPVAWQREQREEWEPKNS